VPVCEEACKHYRRRYPGRPRVGRLTRPCRHCR